MIIRNPNFAKLKNNYLFREIDLRKRAFLEKNPGAHLISLGIGDTTEPLSPSVCRALTAASEQLGTTAGYKGYGPEQGIEVLRKRVSEFIYHGRIQPEEIFISDGAKCDIGRLQILFGNKVSIAVQDPVYPVYLDGSILQGVEDIVFLECLPENNFFPDLSKTPRTDILYFCSPNNPTGAAATRAELEKLVAFAKANKTLIVYDAAYGPFIQNPDLPRSIYEIPGASEVAIETNSFSKLSGFTGVRLGWTVVPEALKYADGFSIRHDWNRLMTTLFNGASNIAQKGGLAVMEEEGMTESKQIIKTYMENAGLLKTALENAGYEVYGGVDAPYLWVRCKGRESWDVFQEFLDKRHLIVTPGSGFGLKGEGYFRISAFNSRENIKTACERLAR